MDRLPLLLIVQIKGVFTFNIPSVFTDYSLYTAFRDSASQNVLYKPTITTIRFNCSFGSTIIIIY